MAAQKDKKAEAQRGSLVGAVLNVMAVTALAAAAGVLTAWLVQSAQPTAKSVADTERPGPKFDPSLVTRPIAPIVASLAGPKRAWIRLEFSVILPPDLGRSDELAALIAQDTLAFVRTVPLDHIDNPLGLAFLREDLEERVQIRTQGKARGLLFRTLVIE